MPTFREDLERFLESGEFDRHDSLFVSDTPSSMIMLGMKQLPIFITKRHVVDVLHPKDPSHSHWHGLGKEDLLAIPELLASPAIIFDSVSRGDSLVFVLAATDEDSLPLIAAIKPNGESWYDCELVASNHLMSVYGKNDLCSLVEKAVRDDHVLFVDEEKTKDLASEAQLQLLRFLEGLPMNTIIHPSQAVLRSNPPDDIPETDLEEAMAEDRSPEPDPAAFEDAKRALMGGKEFYSPESGFYVASRMIDEEPNIVYYRKSLDEIKEFVAVLEGHGVELANGAVAPSRLFLPDDFYVALPQSELPSMLDAAAAQIAGGGWIEVGEDIDSFIARCDAAAPEGTAPPAVRQTGCLASRDAPSARRASLDRDLKAASDSARAQRHDSIRSVKASKKHSELEGM